MTDYLTLARGLGLVGGKVPWHVQCRVTFVSGPSKTLKNPEKACGSHRGRILMKKSTESH